MQDDEQSERTPNQRRPYLRPEITRVPLRPEEAVLGACKSAGIGGPVDADCTVPVGCSSIGS
jgi:hypothetical protein